MGGAIFYPKRGKLNKVGDTKIQWTEKTWNPIRARRIAGDKRGWYCEHVSEGCRNCYAETMNRNTYFGNGLPYQPQVLPQVELFLDEKILQQPLHWKEPQAIFPCSMTDMFGNWVSDAWLDKIHHVMWQASRHTFQVLTKRPERMRDYMSDPNTPKGNPLPNVWLGVSVEDQDTADERIAQLLETPAAKHWVSAEPLLGPLHLCGLGGCCGFHTYDLDWMVIGGESGTKARLFDPVWAQDIIKQLRDEAQRPVAIFVKQMGTAWAKSVNAKNKKGGDIEEWPTNLQVREYPNAQS